jgi:hypothetical protein
MMSATGMMRSQRCDLTEFKLARLLTEEPGVVQWLTFVQSHRQTVQSEQRPQRPFRPHPSRAGREGIVLTTVGQSQ